MYQRSVRTVCFITLPIRVLFGDGSVGRCKRSMSKSKFSSSDSTTVFSFSSISLLGCLRTLFVVDLRRDSNKFSSGVLIRMRVLPAFLLGAIGVEN